MTPKPRKAPPPKKAATKKKPVKSANPVGRPSLYSDKEIFAKRVDDYFNSITLDVPRVTLNTIGYEDVEKQKPIYEQVPVLNNDGVQIIDVKYFEHPSMLGLALFLDIHKDTLNEYAKDPKFSVSIKKARQKIEKYLETELYRGQGQVTGIIFNLKNNFGWVDKQETEHSGSISMPTITIGK